RREPPDPDRSANGPFAEPDARKPVLSAEYPVLIYLEPPRLGDAAEPDVKQLTPGSVQEHGSPVFGCRVESVNRNPVAVSDDNPPDRKLPRRLQFDVVAHGRKGFIGGFAGSLRFPLGFSSNTPETRNSNRGVAGACDHPHFSCVRASGNPR